MIHRLPLSLYVSIIFTSSNSWGAPISLSIVSVSGLDFGVAPQGDGPRTITPTRQADLQSARFMVKGEPNLTYTIFLPTQAVDLQNQQAGSGTSLMKITDFHSIPPSGTNGYLGPQGSQLIIVGATRLALSPTQKRGKYSGTFLITIVY